MALQVWLPLNGNLNNLGLSNITVTNNGATIDNNGKIGKCYYFNGSAQYLEFSQSMPDLYMSDCSWSLWVKPTDDTRSILISEYASSGASNVALELYTNRQIRIYWAASPDWMTGETISKDTWSHIAATRHENTLKLYINGVLKKTLESTLANKTSTSKIRIGDDYRGGTSVSFMGYLNDVRIYDHCLSPKEVKEISKGLVLHYSLNLEYSSVSNMNLIANGWGGTDNWPWASDSKISTDVPSSPTGITHSYSNTTSKEYIPLIHDHSYTMSGYVKKGTSSLSTCYLTLIPYDIDKNQISPKHVNFRTTSLTTLSQDLHSGDTVIHLTDASGWANPGTYQIYVAIFNYQDSSGYTYSPLTYTRNVYQYGTSSDKSNLDVANNLVTLRAAYSGNTVLAGTPVSLSADGATYFYVKTKTNPSDWDLLTGTFIPQDQSYLRPAKYVRVYAALYSGLWTAGITLVDNDAKSIIYDCSGYLHNGTIVGDTGLNINTPRYNSSLTNKTRYPLKSTINFPESKGLTIACWVNPTTFGYQTSALWATSNNSSVPTDYSTTTCSHTDTKLKIKGTDGTLYNLSCTSSDYPLNKWTYLVFTHDGVDAKLYTDGNFTRSIECPTSLVGFNFFYLGASNADPRTTLGSWSDLRIYCTALSANDILELYNTSAFVDNQQNIDCFQFQENLINGSEITKQGLINCNIVNENIEASINYEGVVTANQLIEI